MSESISSARPVSLYRYADTGFRIASELSAEANRLDWVLRHFESTCTEYRVSVSYLADDLRGYARRAEEIDRWVRRVGVDFERADQRSWFGRLQEFIEAWWEGKEQVETWESIFSSVLLASSMRLGSSYTGEVIIDLPDWLKDFGFSLRHIRELAGFSPYLNHIKFTHIPSHLARVAFLVAVIGIGVKWFIDFREYSGSRLASAMTVDAVLTLGTTVGATWAGAKAGLIVGAAIGSVVPGVGTAVGGAVGALVGGIVGGIAAELALDHFHVRERSISWLDDHVFAPVARDIARGMNAVYDRVDEAARRMRQEFDEIERVAQLDVARFRQGVSRGAQDVTRTISNLSQNAGNKSSRFNYALGSVGTSRVGDEAFKAGRELRSIDSGQKSPSSVASTIKGKETHIKINLSEAKPEDSNPKDGCVKYARKRRPDLRGVQVYGAADYIKRLPHKLFRSEEVAHIKDYIVRGNALVWPSHRSDLRNTAGYIYGHIAIVEEVGSDENGEYVIVSQAGVGRNDKLTTYPRWSMHMKIYKKNLDGLYVI